MLPILRTISVGGVFLAITILGLALIPPGRSHLQFAADDQPARGALIDRSAHPEWRQFLIQAALKRADEIDRLRDLPDGRADMGNGATTATAKAADKLAGLPVALDEADVEEQTGAINVAPSATIPIDIGATSSSELPVAPVEEMPPVVRSPVVSTTANDAARSDMPPGLARADANEPPLSKVSALSPPEQAKPVVVIRKRNIWKPAAKTAAAAATTATSMPPPFSILQAIFASFSAGQNVAAKAPARPAIARQQAIKPKKTAGIR